MSRRAFVVVADACGVGALPDAADYGDAGSNTLEHVAQAVGGLQLPVLERLGLGSIVALDGVAPARTPVLHGRLAALGPGKESTTGHWELMGAIAPAPLPTYPNGFPEEVVRALERATGRSFICNRPYNGIAAIDDFGAEHLRDGGLILYTSQDSVLQIAAHVSLLSEQALGEVCVAARAVMAGQHAIGRVIARPFRGRPGAFRRTEGRHDFSVPPPGRTYLDELRDAGVGAWLEAVGPEDLLIVTADHGCDPAAAHSDHTREYAPLLASFEGHEGRRWDGVLSDVGASVLRWLTGADAVALPGTPFVESRVA